MPPNRIAVYGHRGWASSAIVKALSSTTASIRVRYRPDSDVSGLPSTVNTVEVELANEADVVKALDGIDIVISLVGQEGVPLQHHLVAAIAKTKVKLFVPSDLGFRCDEEGRRIPVMGAKSAIEDAAREAGIPMTVIWPGVLAESSLSSPLLGVDIKTNKITFSGNSEHERLCLCTRDYIAAAYAALFATTSIDHLQGRHIRLCELAPTGQELADALERRHGTHPAVRTDTIEWIDQKLEAKLQTGAPFSLMWYCRKIWGTGRLNELVGDDLFEVPGYKKATLPSLIMDGGLVPYREWSDGFRAAYERETEA